MANGDQRKTFLSYSRANKDFAIKLAKELKSEGFHIWLDQLDIPAGARWDREVEKALKESEIFMIILTPASVDSENVLDEIGYAIDNRKRFLPVLLENCEVPFRLRRFQYVDFTNKSFDDGVESAKDLLRNLIAQTTIPRGEIPAQPQDQTAQTEVERKAKEEAERIAKRVADEELAAKAKAETERKAKEDIDRHASQKAGADRVAKQKAEDERLAKAKTEAERKLKQEADRLAAQKAEADRVAKQKAEDERLAKAKAEVERKPKQEAKIANNAPFFFSLWGRILIGVIVGLLLGLLNTLFFSIYYNNFFRYISQILLDALAFAFICGLAGLITYPHKLSIVPIIIGFLVAGVIGYEIAIKTNIVPSYRPFNIIAFGAFLGIPTGALISRILYARKIIK